MSGPCAVIGPGRECRGAGLLKPVGECRRSIRSTACERDTPAAAPVALTGAIIVGLARSNETFSHAAEFGVGTTLEAGLMLVPPISATGRRNHSRPGKVVQNEPLTINVGRHRRCRVPRPWSPTAARSSAHVLGRFGASQRNQLGLLLAVKDPWHGWRRPLLAAQHPLQSPLPPVACAPGKP